MADQSDVQSALVALAANALYPNGSTASSVTGADCLIYPGWPNAASLDTDLAAGRVNVTVFPMTEPGKNTSRFDQKWMGSVIDPSLTVSVAGVTVTIGGTVETNNLLGILVDGRSYVYRPRMTDTLELVAGNIAELIRADRIVTVSGSTVTIAGARSLVSRTVAGAIMTQEIRRQEHGFRVTCWCPTPGTRDVVASAIDFLLATYQFLKLSDGTMGRLRYRGSLVFDQSQDALLYRRDLIYDVDYPTTVAELQPAMLFGNLILNADSITV